MLFPSVIAVIVYAATRGPGARPRRDALLGNWAQARGWGYRALWPEMVGRFWRFPFSRGDHRSAQRGFWGMFDNVQVFGFDYVYMDYKGRSRVTFRQLITGVSFPGANFPYMVIMREPLVRLRRDIQFENEDFNKTWNVNSSSVRFAHDVMHPRAMALFMQANPQLERIWFERDVVLMSTSGEPTPDFIDHQLRFLTQFVGQLPSFLLREVGTNVRHRPELSGPGVAHDVQVGSAQPMMQARRDGTQGTVGGV